MVRALVSCMTMCRTVQQETSLRNAGAEFNRNIYMTGFSGTPCRIKCHVSKTVKPGMLYLDIYKINAKDT